MKGLTYQRDTHTLLNQSLTAKAEQQLINKILPLLPSWINSDILTFTGLTSSFIIAGGYILSSQNKSLLFLACFGFILHWFGDSFDGQLARFRKKTRPNYGYYIDHIIDGLSVAIFGLGLGYSPFIRIETAFAFILVYLLAEIHVLLVKSVQNVFKLSLGLFGPTELRILGIILSLYIYFSSPHHLIILKANITQYDLILITTLIIMTPTLVINIIQKGIELNNIDTHNWKK